MKGKKTSFADARKWNRYQFFGSASVIVGNDKKVKDATVANISLSGIGLYSRYSIGKGKKVKVKISFIDKYGKTQDDTVRGKVDWQSKFRKMYLVGIIFEDELNMSQQPKLLEHLSWLIDTYKWPQPYKDKRIAML
jgi:hypothetical protein